MKTETSSCRLIRSFLTVAALAVALAGCGGGATGANGVANAGGGNGGTPPPTYSISGTISGLNAGSSITLQNNGGDNLTRSANGSFTFATNLQSGAAYNVSILTPPANQPCTSTYTAGTVNAANVTNVNVICGPTPVGAFSTGASMATPRSNFTLTVLPNGKVLAAGGINYGVGPQAINPLTILSSAELYDPATNTWSSTGSMANVREGHTATLLANGKVLVVGGSSTYYNTLNTAEVYDPTTGAWSATGIMVDSHQYHTTTQLANGKVLVAGGCNSPTGVTHACAELYDPAANTWSAAGAMSAARISHMAVLLPNGKVLVAGGVNSTSGLLSSAELYDPAADVWTAASSMTTARSGLYTSLLPSGKVMVSDGATTETYDPASNTWAAAGNTALGTQAAIPFATLLPTGKVLATDKSGSAALFDPATNTWAATGSMPAPRVSHAGALLPNGKVLIAGGWILGAISTNTTQLYW